MAVAETSNAPGQILTSAATRLLLTYSRVKQQSFDFIISANHISRLRELCGNVRIGNGDDLHAGGNAGRDTRFGVFDHPTILRAYLKQFRRAEKNIRRRLAARYVRTAHDDREKPAQAFQ